jgi:hypothetical protein
MRPPDVTDEDEPVYQFGGHRNHLAARLCRGSLRYGSGEREGKESSVENLEVPRPAARSPRRKKPTQRAGCPTLATDDLAQVILDHRHLEGVSFTLKLFIDLDSLPLVDEKRDDVPKIVSYRHDQATDFSW